MRTSLKIDFAMTFRAARAAIIPIVLLLCSSAIAFGQNPGISSISPTSATAGSATFTLTVNGSNFIVGAQVQWANSGVTTTLATIVVSSTQVTATVTADLIASAGSAAVRVVNPGVATASNLGSFEIDPVLSNPIISSLSPGQALPGGAQFTLTVNGSGFASGAGVQWTNSSAVVTNLSTSFGGATQLTAIVPATLIASQGSATVTVVNPGNFFSNSVVFQITTVSSTLTITSLSPAQATAGGAQFTLTVNGSGFFSNAVVQWNGSALTTSFINASQLTAVVPASLIVSAGTANITVQNAGVTGISNTATFTISVLSALRLAHILDGAGWTTLFVVENLDVVPVNYSFNFWNDSGGSLAIPFVNGSPGMLSGTLLVGGTAFVQTPGTSTALLQGWAEALSTGGKIGVTAILRYSAPGVPDSEGSVIGTPSSSSISMPYDNTQAHIMGIAVANANATQSLTISLLFQTDGGGQSTAQITLPAHGHAAFILPNSFQTTAGTRGSIHFTASSADLTVIGLRFSPSLTFASLGAFQ